MHQISGKIKHLAFINVHKSYNLGTVYPQFLYLHNSYGYHFSRASQFFALLRSFMCEENLQFKQHRDWSHKGPEEIRSTLFRSTSSG